MRTTFTEWTPEKAMSNPVVDLSPDSVQAIVDLFIASRITPNAPKPPAMTPEQAIAYSGRCKTAVFGFMRRYPAACTVGADGIRRVLTPWLDAWILGKAELDELICASEQVAKPRRGGRATS